MNYGNGKIYKIVSNKTGECYVGSTTGELESRLKEHQSKLKSFVHGSGAYYTSFQILEGGDYEIKLAEECGCSLKHELLSKEREWILRSEKEICDCGGIYRKQDRNRLLATTHKNL